MKRVALMFAAASVFISCNSPAKEPVFTIPPDYHKWKRPLKKAVEYMVPGHGKSSRIVYANNTAFERYTIKDERGAARILCPDGSIVIKEVYADKKDIGKKEPVLDIMVKRSGAAGSMDGWLYYMKQPGGPVVHVTGRLCAGCHEAANEMHPYFDKNEKGIFRDYLFHPHR
jgi:hypothetical protein